MPTNNEETMSARLDLLETVIRRVGKPVGGRILVNGVKDNPLFVVPGGDPIHAVRRVMRENTGPGKRFRRVGQTWTMPDMLGAGAETTLLDSDDDEDWTDDDANSREELPD